jgi:hypothetical protein
MVRKRRFDVVHFDSSDPEVRDDDVAAGNDTLQFDRDARNVFEDRSQGELAGRDGKRRLGGHGY